jgi:hypothetical protein
MATILTFPRRPRIQQSTVISLYTDEEIAVTLTAVNLHNDSYGKVQEHDLNELDAEIVERCLREASVNQLLSTRARRCAVRILASIQHVNIRQQM